MNIHAITTIINKELGADINADYHNKIDEWRQWWAGYVKAFHNYNETTDTGRKKQRTLYSMKMAKKICEDWAFVLLNEKTRIVIKDNATSKFLQGPENEEGCGGVFRDINFWAQANSLVEKAFYSGTGAFVMKLDGLRLGANGAILKSAGANIRMEYLPAMCIFPVSVKYGQIIEVCFASEITQRGNTFVYLEIHTLQNGQYVINNRYYKDFGGQLTPAPLPDGVAATIYTGSPYAWFSIINA